MRALKVLNISGVSVLLFMKKHYTILNTSSINCTNDFAPAFDCVLNGPHLSEWINSSLLVTLWDGSFLL